MTTNTQPSWGKVLLNAFRPNIEKSKTRMNCAGLYLLAADAAFLGIVPDNFVLPIAMALVAGIGWNLHEKMAE